MQSVTAATDNTAAVAKPYLKTSNVPPTIVLIFSCVSFVICFIVMCLYGLILVGILQYYEVIPWYGVLIVILIVLLFAAAPCVLGLIIYEVFRRIQK